MCSKDKRPSKQVVNQEELCITDIYANTTSNASITIHQSYPDADIAKLDRLIETKVNAAVAGDTSEMEKILAAQAITLDAIFHNNAIKANRFKNPIQARVLLELALKAQKHSRQTISALANIKNPPGTTFVKQQNNAVNQQVNNHAKPTISEKKSRNELLSEVKDETVDTRGTFETIPANKEMETVGAVNGAKDD